MVIICTEKLQLPVSHPRLPFIMLKFRLQAPSQSHTKASEFFLLQTR